MLSKQQQFILSELHNPEFDETSDGSEIHLDCVFCGDYRKKLYINHQGKGICFLCGTVFNSVVSFLMQYEKLSKQEAFVRAKGLQDSVSSETFNRAQEVGIFDSLLSLQPSKKDKRPPKLPTNTKLLIDNFRNSEAFPYFLYLKNRGLSLDDINKYKIMYVYNGVYHYNNTDLAIKRSIVFPTFDSHNKIVYWNTRAIDNINYVKSINAPSDNGETITKQSAVWNANNIQAGGNIVICEGVFNAIMADSQLFTGVATFGKQITDNQLRIIHDYNPLNYYIALDNDAYDTALNLIKRITKLGVPISNIYFVTKSMLQYKGKDFNDLGKSKTQEILKQTVPMTNSDLLELQLHQYI